MSEGGRKGRREGGRERGRGREKEEFKGTCFSQ